MQGRETLGGEKEGLGNLGLGNELFGYYFEELIYGLDLLVPGPFCLVCPSFVQQPQAPF